MVIKITACESDIITWVVPKLFEILFELNKPLHSLALFNPFQPLKEAAKRLPMLGFQSSCQTSEGLDRKDNEDC